MSKSKATIDELKISYEKHKSVWKVAQEFNMCGQSVHERLQKEGFEFKTNHFTQDEIAQIKECYKKPFKRGESPLKKLSVQLGRQYTSIVRKAKQMGLTIQNRKDSKFIIDERTKRIKNWHQENEHPRGMKGKTHSEEYKKKCGHRLFMYWKNASEEEKYLNRKKALMTMRKNARDQRIRGSWKAAWRVIGGKRKFYRSAWEANYARYLEYLKKEGHIKDWEHEPQTFWFEGIKRGVRSYLPDFKVYNHDGSHYWVEVKGYMDDKSKTKIKRFHKYFPNEKLELKDAKWFAKCSSKIKIVCPEWE